MKRNLLLLIICILLNLKPFAQTAGDQGSKMGYIVGIGHAYTDAVNNYNGKERMYRRSDFWGWRVELVGCLSPFFQSQ